MAKAICGEPRYPLADANKLGYYTSKQIAAAMPGQVSQDIVTRGIRKAGEKYEHVLLTGTGGEKAYRLRRR